MAQQDVIVFCTLYKVINVFILHLSRLFCRDSAFIGTVCPGVQESEGGLYVCMNTFLGFGREHVERHYRKTGQCVYMHLKRHVKEVRYTSDFYFCWLLVLNGSVFVIMILWCVILFYSFFIQLLLHCKENNVEHFFQL